MKPGRLSGKFSLTNVMSISLMYLLTYIAIILFIVTALFNLNHVVE